MMLAMMHVLIRDGLVDDTWVAEHTTGFDELAESVADWTPERAATATGLAAADIEALARDYGTTRPVAIRTLIGGEHHENGAMFFRTLACLPALVGAWSDRGGGLARSVGRWQDQLCDERRARPARPARRPQPALVQHEPPRRSAHRVGSPGARDDRVELQPARDRAERRADPARPRARRPVHDRARAVPHRHGQVRRHRAAGDDADRGDRRRARLGSPLDGMERGGHRAARRVGQQRELFRRIARCDGARRTVALRRRRDDPSPITPEHRSRRPAPRRMGARAVPRRRSTVGERRVPDGVRQGRVGQ